MASKTPTLAQLRELAKRKRATIKISYGSFPIPEASERANLFLALSALPDKAGAR